MPYYLQTTPGVIAILVRHGQTPDNTAVNTKVRGWHDIELSNEGRLNVQITAMKLRKFKPQAIVSSDFMRDSETAEILAGRLGIADKEVDYDARTWDTGLFSGQPEKVVQPAIDDLYLRSWEAPPGSGESFDTFSKRWQSFLDRKLEYAAKVEAARPLIIVTHGRNIALADSYFNHKLPQDGIMPLAAGYAVISVGLDYKINVEVIPPSEGVCQDV